MGDAELGLVAGQQGHGLGAGEEVLGRGHLTAGPDGPRGAGVVGLIDVELAVLGVAVDGVDLLARIGDQGRQPVFVGDAGPGAGGVELLGRGAVLRQVLVLERPHAPVEVADRALVDDAVFADVRRHALALHRAIGRERHRQGAGVGDGVGEGEHVVLVHVDLARERQALAVGVGQDDRLAGRERGALGERPGGGGARQARHVLADPAEVHEPGEGRAFRPQHLDRRRVLGRRLAVLGEEEVVEACAAQRDRALQRRRRHRDTGAGGQGRGAGHGRRRGERGGARHHRGGGRRVGLELGLAAPVRRLDHPDLVDDEQDRGAYAEDEQVTIVFGHRGEAAQSWEGGACAGSRARPSPSAASLISALFTSSSKRGQGRVVTPPRAMNT